jgi:hypothetical protein
VPSHVLEGLEEVTHVEIEVARHAQRAEIVDLHVAQLMRSGAGVQGLTQLKDVLDLPAEPSLPSILYASPDHR